MDNSSIIICGPLFWRYVQEKIVKFEQLKKYKGSLQKVRLKRSYPSEVFLNGFIHLVTKKIVIIQQYHDFYAEGYSVIRTSDIISIRSNKYERFFEEMFKDEGLIDKVKKPNIPELKSMKRVLKHFQRNEKNIIIECESENDEIFMCGKVSEIENGTVWVKEFDALGKWRNKEVGIELKNITKVQFETPYVNIFSKYIPDITQCT